MKEKISKICGYFGLDGKDLVKASPFGSGHINDTIRAVFRKDRKQEKYVFQQINTNVFRQPEALMDNVSRVLAHYAGKLKGHPDEARRCIHLLTTDDGKTYINNENGFWRGYHFVEGVKTFDILETEDQAYQAAKAFGTFQYMISDLPGERLFETIPNFHNTPSRLANFEESLKKDVKGRAKEAEKEIAFVEAHKWMAPVLIEAMKKGEIPERITHNDTKLNNVLLDSSTGEGICVIDLDTVMPGSSLYDFGDLVRTSVSPAAEDEVNLREVQCRENMFRMLVKGYLEGANGCLTKKEIELMPFAGMLITFEIGLRFLTDFLDGDIYFKTKRENHNLDRCRTQFTLVQRLEEKESLLKEIIKEFEA